jgi:uncharacterized SAM-binding protein YcdF (DUF218 family)
MKNLLEAPRIGGQVRAWWVPATAVATVIATSGWWLLDTPSALSHRLVLHLENTFPRANLEDGRAITGVIALGGGEARIREAGRLARRYAQLQIVVTGAGERDYVLGVLGRDIAPDRVLVDTQARNTYENAVRSKAAAHPSAGERWLLVTSAAHMPRAIASFRGQGFAAEAWPIWDLDAYRPRPASVARHEWLGLAGYWLLGRTSALLPSSIQALERSEADHRVASVTRGKILR